MRGASHDELGVHSFSDELLAQFPDERLGKFQEQIAEWRELFVRAQNMAYYEEARLRETGKLMARRQIGHLAAAVSIRVVDLSSGLVVLLNERLPHPTYAVARAIVETSAVPAYAVRNVVPYLAKGRVEATRDTLRRMSLGIDPGLVAAINNDELAVKRAAQPIRVSKLVSALASVASELHGTVNNKLAGDSLRDFYSNVSDYTHPNTSAMHLSSAIDEDGMHWSRPAKLEEGVVTDVVGVSSLALWYGGWAMDALLKAANAYRLVLRDIRDER